MNLAEIIQIKMDLENAGHAVLCSITKSKYNCFSDTTVTLDLSTQEQFRLTSHIDLFQQTVYMVDYHIYSQNMVLRWVHPHHETYFAKDLFERQEDPTKTQYGMQIRRFHDRDFFSCIIHGDVFMLEDKDSQEEDEYESVSLELTDSELATIARAAHVKDMTINDFINEALRIELDHVMPAWREEYKNGGL